MTLDINVTANYLLADEAAKILREQNLDASIVLTSSANAVVPKRGSEAYDVSKAALSHLVRELAISLSPKIRVNGISPATVIKGSTMFPRDRVIASLKKYQIPFEESVSDEQLRTLLAEFYAKRTLTHRAIDPKDCAEAILFLAGPKSPLHHRPHHSRGWRTDRGFLAMSDVPRDRNAGTGDQSPRPTVTQEQEAALVAVDLGAESCRVSLLRWDGRSSGNSPGPSFPQFCQQTNGSGLHWDITRILRRRRKRTARMRANRARRNRRHRRGWMGGRLRAPGTAWQASR